MKKTYLLTGFLASLLFFNCSKDDSNDDIDKTNVAQNSIEESVIELSTLEKGISIEGSILNTGTISPNELTSFSVTKTEQSGFQDVGFEIKLNVPENYAGAYLQLLTEDGKLSDSYYDIPGNSYSYKALKKNTYSAFSSIKKSNLNAKTVVYENEPTTIEVDFDETIPAGTFCYFLCIYDTEGNISAPQTLCVEVEAWGGNDALAGNWTFTKQTEINNNISKTRNVGEKSCYTDFVSTSCTNADGSTIDLEKSLCNVIETLSLNFYSNGTQDYYIEDQDEEFDWDESYSTCESIIDVYTDKRSYSGNWAYDEEEKRLTLVDYNFDSEKTKNGDPYVDPYDDNITYETGVGFDLEVTKLTSNELVLINSQIDYEYNENSNTYEEVEYINEFYFTK